MKKHRYRDQRGITLLLAIVVVSLLLSAGLNLTFVATKELGFSRLTSDSVKAHYAAESALECAVYWMFNKDGVDYFKTTGTNNIKCNDTEISFSMDSPVAPSDAYTTTIELGAGTDQYSAVLVERTPNSSGNYDDKNFTLSSEGFNDDVSLGNDPSLVQQEIGAVSIESCNFSPDNADADGNTTGNVTVSSVSNLQATLDQAFKDASGNSRIDVDNDNKGYQTWRLDVPVGATVFMETIPLSASASYIDTFGYYTNDLGSPYTSATQIYDNNEFMPVFSNNSPACDSGTGVWSVPELTQNNNHRDDWVDADWEAFEINVAAGGAIAFAIDAQVNQSPSESCPRNAFSLKTTEKTLNAGNKQNVLAYDVPPDLWSDPEVPEYVLAFEDAFDNDYNDMVAVVRIKGCVSQFQRY